MNNQAGGIRETVPVKVWVAVTLISAVIAAVGQVLSNPLQEFFSPETLGRDAPETRPAESIPLQEAVKDGSLFGSWVSKNAEGTPLRADTPYQAPSGGFISAYTGGNNPAGGILIYVSKGLSDLSNRDSIRTRTGRYDGVVCPVPKGRYWKAESDNGGGITIQWLPVVSSP